MAIRDGLKVRHVASLISKIRRVVVAARSPKIDAILMRKANKGAILYQATRWGSTYLMLERLLELKPALIDIVHPDVSLSDTPWNEVKQLEGLLRHPFLSTKQLQAGDLTPGTFFKEWKKFIFKFFQIGGILADARRTSMECREKILLDNNVLLAAVYVYPMYRMTLNDGERAKRKAALLQFALSLKHHEERRCGANLFEEENQSNRTENFSFTSESEDEHFEKLLNRQAKRRKTDTEDAASNSSPLRLFKMDFNNALRDMENIDRSSKVTVMNAIFRYLVILQKVHSHSFAVNTS